MRVRCFLFLAGLGLLLGPAAGPGQSNGGGEKAGVNDLPERWQQLAGDRATWRRADITDPLQRFVFDLVAEKVQAQGGEINKKQFLGMARHPAGQSANGQAQPGVQKKDKRTTGNQGASAPAGPKVNLVAEAEAEFRRLDTNGDGLLNSDEMDDVLRAECAKWDANRDGFIDLPEFKAYYKARKERERAAQTAMAGKGFRSGDAADSSAELPSWFRDYDTDGDGQIGLYEWRAAGQPIARFLAMDANGDGFLTPDEVLWAMSHENTAPGTGAGK